MDEGSGEADVETPERTAVSVDVDLSSTVAVVTGVCGRLGWIWTKAFLDSAARVCGIDVNPRPGERLSEVLAQHPADRFLLVKGDVTGRNDLEAALRACRSEFGSPTVLVNNAGIDQPPGAAGSTWRFGDIPDEVSAGVLTVNAYGVLLACQVFGSEMAEQGHGAIVNIGSLYGTAAPDPRLYEHLPVDPPFLKPPAYSMSKAGVAALTRYLAALWGPRGVRVNTLSPGGVQGGQDDQFRSKFTARVPMGRMAEPEDLIGPMLFLASDMSRYVTGVELSVDGGYLCW